MNGLPRLLVITDRHLAIGPLDGVVGAAVAYGARAVMVRDREMPAAERDALVDRLRPVLAEAGGTLIVAGRRGDAVHLSRHEAFPAHSPELVGRSCHDASEVDRALAEGCHYVTVAPVALTSSKPGYGPALGLAGLRALCRPGLPTYALGGVVPGDVGAYLAAGAYGVAVMGPVMRDPSTVADYLKELPT